MNKKVAVILLGLLFIGLLTLCLCIGLHIFPFQGDLEQTTQAETLDAADEETVSPVDRFNWYWLDQNGEIVVLDYLPATRSWDEYDAYCWYFAEHFSERFVSYDMLEGLGSFDSFVFYPWDDAGVVTTYSYGLHGDDNVNLDITFHHLSEGESSDIRDHRPGDNRYYPTSGEDTSDMRTSDHRDMIVRLNNADFLYDTNGEIVHIITYISGYKITIKPGTMFYDDGRIERCSLRGYDLSDKNFISLLLSGAEREDVEKAFLDMIS